MLMELQGPLMLQMAFKWWRDHTMSATQQAEIKRMSLRDAAQHRHDVMMMQRDVEHLKECYVREVRNAMN